MAQEQTVEPKPKKMAAIVTPGMGTGGGYGDLATLVLRALEATAYRGLIVATAEDALRVAESGDTIVFLTSKVANQAEAIANTNPDIRVLLFGTGPRPDIKKAVWVPKKAASAIKDLLTFF